MKSPFVDFPSVLPENFINENYQPNDFSLESPFVNPISEAPYQTDVSDEMDNFSFSEMEFEGEETDEYEYNQGNSDLYFENEVNSTGVPSYLSPLKNAHATGLNVNLVRNSGISVSAIFEAIRRTIDISAIRQSITAYNASNSGNQYRIDESENGAVDAVFTEGLRQFQVANYIDPKEHDGVLGQSTLDTLGFTNHGLKRKLNSAGFYGQSILNGNRTAVANATNNEFTAANWFDGIIKPAFLGIKISQGIHVLFFRQLREAELWLLSQPQYTGKTPAELGRIFGFNSTTSYSGARLSAKKQAMHGFGLALDINVMGNPWIGAGWVKNDPILKLERTRMIRTLRNASGQSLPGQTVFAYLHSIAQTSGNDTSAAYRTLKQRSDEFVAHLRNTPSELSYWRRSQSFGSRDPLNGFLTLHADLVYSLRQVKGLAWGAIDFGPNASGDIMHFDLRTIGVGKVLCKAIKGYIPKNGHPLINTSSSQSEYSEETEEFENHEAIEEAEWTDEAPYNEINFENENDEYFSDETDQLHDHLTFEPEEFVTDILKAVRINQRYAQTLGWGQFQDKINELVLPFSGMQNVSLDAETFARAVAGWQRQNGFSEKDSDGIIGPLTWRRIQPFINSNPSGASVNIPISPAISPAASASVDPRVVSNINQYKNIIENYCWQSGLNPSIAKAIIAVESSGNKNAGTGGGYKGLMQAETTRDQYVPEISIRTGVDKFIKFRDKSLNPWLRRLGITFSPQDENYLKICLSCYNAGPVTALKAVQYASFSGDYRQWLSGENYLRALLFSGGYARGSSCKAGASPDQVRAAEMQRKHYKFKSNAWRSEPDPPAWNVVSPVINPILKCWIESKFRNTPVYLNRFIAYYRHFNSETTQNETHAEPEENSEYLNDEFSEMEMYSNENFEELVGDIEKTKTLNRNYSVSLGWNQFADQINELLLPFSGQQNVSLGEEAFANALAVWQSRNGFSPAQSDGILGPASWRKMQLLFGPNSSMPPSSPGTGLPIPNATVQDEWNRSETIKRFYTDPAVYSAKRASVVRWRIADPAGYIEAAILEWNANPQMHRYFKSFHNDAHSSYLNLKRLFNRKGIPNIPQYISNDITKVSFFGKESPGHKDLKTKLENAEAVLRGTGHSYTLKTAWSFVPRTFNFDINKLSNHALGKAIDINYFENPHIKSKYEILVINTVCASVLPNGFLNETNPDILRSASLLFQSTFNETWLNSQTPAVISAAHASKDVRANLNRYASYGFLNLPSVMIRALQNTGLRWGGGWNTSKDFMHFELTG